MGLLDKIEKKMVKHPLKEKSYETRISYLNAIAFFIAIDEKVTDSEKKYFNNLIELLECEDVKEDLLEFVRNPNSGEFEDTFKLLEQNDLFGVYWLDILSFKDELTWNEEEKKFHQLIDDNFKSYYSLQTAKKEKIAQTLWKWSDEYDLDLPKDVEKLFNLTKLIFPLDVLTELPKEIGNLTNLTWLILGKSGLTELPKEIGNLTNLTELILWANELTELPKEIGNLTNLTKLNLGNNKLTELPKEIGNLTNLTELNLGNNKLTELPKEIGNLTNLTELNLRNNKLTELPKELQEIELLFYDGYIKFV